MKRLACQQIERLEYKEIRQVDKDFEIIVQEILQSPKYRSLGIPADTIFDLLHQEQENYRDRKSLVKSVRQKLHNIVAPYLEDLDYVEASGWFTDKASQDDAFLKSICDRILRTHASTRERLPFLREFYEHIFKLTGKPDSILDLACGLHPFSFPWMGLPVGVRFSTYDIHAPRVALINRYFSLQGLEPLAEVRDVLVEPPQKPASIAFLFKEAHRMEQRKRGCSRLFWQTLNVRFLLVSLPTASLSGRHDLATKHRRLVAEITGDLPWRITELEFPNELVFVIDKHAGRE
jgi:16S rRNA (guanine(1405)-N(7))-methyltransferase